MLPIQDFEAFGSSLVIQCNNSSDKFVDAQTVADQCDVNILLLSLHGVPNNWEYEFLDHLPGAVSQVIGTLSFGEFALSSVRDGEYTFGPMLLIRKSTLTRDITLISFCDAEVLFPEKRRGNQLWVGRFRLGCLDGSSGVVCAEEWGSEDVGEGRCGE